MDVTTMQKSIVILFTYSDALTLFISWSVYQSIYLSINLSTYQSIYLQMAVSESPTIILFKSCLSTVRSCRRVNDDIVSLDPAHRPSVRAFSHNKMLGLHFLACRFAPSAELSENPPCSSGTWETNMSTLTVTTILLTNYSRDDFLWQLFVQKMLFFSSKLHFHFLIKAKTVSHEQNKLLLSPFKGKYCDDGMMTLNVVFIIDEQFVPGFNIL